MGVNTNTHSGPSFSLKNRITRLIWGMTYAIFFRLSPKPFHGYRSFVLRLFGAKVGKNVHVYPKVKIWAPWNLILKDECGIANDVNLYSQGIIEVGFRAVVSQGCHIVTGSHDYNEEGFPLYTKDIRIGDFAWVAADSFIHPGVQIGDGCVVGARSVVVKNLPEWMICTGHPCVPIKNREKKEFHTIG